MGKQPRCKACHDNVNLVAVAIVMRQLRRVHDPSDEELALNLSLHVCDHGQRRCGQEVLTAVPVLLACFSNTATARTRSHHMRAESKTGLAPALAFTASASPKVASEGIDQCDVVAAGVCGKCCTAACGLWCTVATMRRRLCVQLQTHAQTENAEPAGTAIILPVLSPRHSSAVRRESDMPLCTRP